MLLRSISEGLSLEHNFILIFGFDLQVGSLVELSRYVEGRVFRWSIKLGFAHYGTIFDIIKVRNCDAILSIALSFTVGLDDVPSSFAFYLNNSTCLKLIYFTCFNVVKYK